MPWGNARPLNNPIDLHLSIYLNLWHKSQAPVRLSCLTEWPDKIMVSVNYPENVAHLVKEAMG